MRTDSSHPADSALRPTESEILSALELSRASIPLERIVQIHLAGGRYVRDMLVDTHSAPVPERAWEMLAYVLDRVPVKAILLEWDQDWPDFGVLLDHLDRARALMRSSRQARERR